MKTFCIIAIDPRQRKRKVLAIEFFRLIITLLIIAHAPVVRSKLNYKVNCTSDRMLIEIEKPDYESHIYLDNLKYLPEIGCQPNYGEDKALFDLSLRNFSICGITRVTHQISGTRTYHQRIIVEHADELDNREILHFKCTIPGPGPTLPHITKRDVLPAGFKEQEDIESIMTVETNAPEPLLNVTVKQGLSLVDGELNVKPGTPLTMEIYLDQKSVPVYGLLVNFMRVSDTVSQDETIIFNGCSVDPYLFENFNTIDGNVLAAKFRAFKFPETTYVQFTGTVNICLGKCQGIRCSHGQIGYGRKKRETAAEISRDPKKVFEVTLTTFLKVDFKDVQHLEDV